MKVAPDRIHVGKHILIALRLALKVDGLIDCLVELLVLFKNFCDVLVVGRVKVVREQACHGRRNRLWKIAEAIYNVVEPVCAELLGGIGRRLPLRRTIREGVRPARGAMNHAVLSLHTDRAKVMSFMLGVVFAGVLRVALGTCTAAGAGVPLARVPCFVLILRWLFRSAAEIRSKAMWRVALPRRAQDRLFFGAIHLGDSKHGRNDTTCLGRIIAKCDSTP